MVKKSKLAKSRLDKYYWQAKGQGLRSRAAFKLMQLDRKHDLLSSAQCVIDLCAAPGGWLQVCKKNMPVSSVLIGVDLVPIKDISGAITIINDIKSQNCRSQLSKILKKQKADLVLNDGAPNVGGTWDKDSYDQVELSLYALKLACAFLKKNGTFVTKIFRSRDYPAFLSACKNFFAKVIVTKPHSSRETSAEIYVVCKKFNGNVDQKSDMLNPKFVFRHVEEETKSKSIFNVKPQKRNRGGYSTDLLDIKSVFWHEFVEHQKPEHLLTEIQAIKIDEKSIEKLEGLEIPEEIKLLCDDLLVLNKGDFKYLLKFRKTCVRHLNKIQKNKEKLEKINTKNDLNNQKISKIDEKIDKKSVNNEKNNNFVKISGKNEQKNVKNDQIVSNFDEIDANNDNKTFSNYDEIDENKKIVSNFDEIDQKDEKIDQNNEKIENSPKIEQILEKIEPKTEKLQNLLKKKNRTIDRKKHKMKMNSLKRLNRPERKGVNIESSDDELFSSNKNNNFFEFEKNENERIKSSSEDEYDEKDIIEENEDSEEFYKNEEEYYDNLYEKYLENKHIKSKELNDQIQLKIEQKMNKKLKTNKNNKNQKNDKNKIIPENNDDFEIIPENNDNYDQNHQNDEKIGKNNKNLAKNDQNNEKIDKNLNKKSGEEIFKENWFSTSVFKEFSEACKGKEKEKIDELYLDLPYKKLKQLKNKKRAALREKRLAYQAEKKKASGEIDSLKNPENVDEIGGFEEVEMSSDFTSDTDAIAETLAIGKAMLSKRRKEEIIDESYKNFTFEDHRDLPRWFTDDEKDNFKANKPVTKEEIEYYKSILAPKIKKKTKKELEWQARKKSRKRKLFEKMKSKMNSILNSTEMTNLQKNIAVEKLKGKYEQNKRRKVIYKISQKGGSKSAKEINRRSKLKKQKNAKVKLVDRRMKADKRKAMTKNSKKGKKGKKGNKKGRKGKKGKN